MATLYAHNSVKQLWMLGLEMFFGVCCVWRGVQGLATGQTSLGQEGGIDLIVLPDGVRVPPLHFERISIIEGRQFEPLLFTIVTTRLGQLQKTVEAVNNKQK